MFELHPSKVATIKNDVLSGLTVALALVPEAVAFAFVAGVEPLVGLYAAFMVGLITSAFIALSTVGYRSLRAARANPVASLKEE